MIKIKNVSKYYKSENNVTLALQNINLEFNQGEFVAICGESGSGKSTLLNIITGLDSYDEGEIYFKGNETSYFNIDDMDNFRKKNVSFIFQNYNIIDSYTVLQNVMFPLLLEGLPKKEAKVKALELIKKVNLENVINNRATKLSGGQKQRVAIARALATTAPILACDEPTGNLDSETSKEIISLIKEVASDKLVLVVSHNYEEIKDVCTRKIVVSDGKIISDQVFKTLPPDNDEVLNLDYEKLSNKTISMLTGLNILSTPKKTTILSIVLFLISLVVLTLYQSIVTTYNDSTMTYGYTKYGIYDSNFLVAYNDGKEITNLDKFNDIPGDVKFNPFSEYVEFEMGIAGFRDYYNRVKVIDYDIKLEKLVGSLPSRDDDALLILPYNEFGYEDYYKNNITILNKAEEEMSLYITGIGYSNYMSQPFLKVDKSKTTFFNKGIFNDNLSVHTNTSLEVRSFCGNNTGKIIVTIPFGYDVDSLNLEIQFAEKYILDLPYELRYHSENYIEFSYPLNCEIDLPVYEVRVYSDDITNVIKMLEDNSLSYVYPATKEDMDLGTVISLVVYLVLTIIPMILLYFISFIILNRIYISKKREYTIMRMVGVARYDMRRLVLFETMILGIVSSIFVYLLCFSLGFMPLRLFRIFKHISLFATIIYFIVMLVFANFLGRKFARRLFKDTSNSTLKEVL